MSGLGSAVAAHRAIEGGGGGGSEDGGAGGASASDDALSGGEWFFQEPDELPEEDAPTADQRAAVSKEMTNLLMRRIKGLSMLAEARQRGADHDVNAASEERTSKVVDPRTSILDDEKDEDDDDDEDLRGKGKEASKDERISSDRLLLGGTAGHKRRPMSASSDASDLSAKDNEILEELQKQLHTAESTLMGRMVDSIRYDIDAVQPISIPWRTVLRYTGHVITYPYTRNRVLQRHFRFWIVKPLSCEIIRSLFWLCHLQIFQKDSEHMEDRLIQPVCRNWVKLLHGVRTNKEFFFQSYPYAIAFAICSAFYYYIPGSRSHYTRTFRLRVYVTVTRMLFGMELCAVSVQRTAERLFPIEAPASIGDHGAGAKKQTTGTGTDENVPRPETAKASDTLDPEWAERVTAIHTLPTTLVFPMLSTAPPLGAGQTFPKPESAPALSKTHIDTLRRTRSARKARMPSSASSTGSDGGGERARTAGGASGRRAQRAADGSARVPPSPASQADPVASMFGKTTGRSSVTGSSTGRRGVAFGNSGRRSSGVSLGAESAETTKSEAEERLDKLMSVSGGKQIRVPFRASHISPMMQRFLDTTTQTVGTTINLRRTTPVPWVRTGGVDTFHREADSLRRPDSRGSKPKLMNTYKARAFREHHELLGTLRDVNGARDKVLHGGMAEVSKFCLDITRERSRKETAPAAKSVEELKYLEAAQEQAEKLRLATLAGLPSPSPLLGAHVAASPMVTAMAFGFQGQRIPESPSSHKPRVHGGLGDTGSTHTGLDSRGGSRAFGHGDAGSVGGFGTHAESGSATPHGGDD